MAAPVRITRERLAAAALELVRQGGPEALNARALARALGCSTQPIFRNFASMEALRDAVLDRAHGLYRTGLEARMVQSPYPPYKAAGMAYIAFAREEPQLFRLLFMRSRSGAEEGPETGDWRAGPRGWGRSRPSSFIWRCGRWSTGWRSCRPRAICSWRRRPSAGF